MSCHKSPIRTSYWFSISGDPGLIHCYKNSLGENPFLKGSSGYWRVRRGVVQGSPSRVGSKVQLPPHPLGVPISSASWSPKSSPLKKKPQGLPYCLCPGDHRVECKGVPGPVTLNMLRQMWKHYETQSCNLFIRTSSSVWEPQPCTIQEVGEAVSWQLEKLTRVPEGSSDHPLSFLCWCFVCSVCVWKSPQHMFTFYKERLMGLLRLYPPSAGGLGSVPGQEIRFHLWQLKVRMLQLKIPHAANKTWEQPNSNSIHLEKKKRCTKAGERHHKAAGLPATEGGSSVSGLRVHDCVSLRALGPIR